ncbi:MAG TPA: RecX family transcriptional regulator [Gaiellaceae bacterium]|nr:RecX family transcriptional regulator [Gaiellaceae bacterium]
MPSRAESGLAGADAAVDAALRLLRYRDRSAAQIDQALAAREIGADAREDALETLRRTGLVDDYQFAERRAATLAARGAGDAFIRHDLEAAGIAPGVVEDVLAGLEGEQERARRIVERRGASSKTSRYLAGKGFSTDAVHAAIARAGDEPLG